MFFSKRELLRAKNGATIQFSGEDSEIGGISFNNNMILSSSSPVTMSLKESFNVTGADSYFSSDLNVSSSLNVNGNSIFENNLQIVGELKGSGETYLLGNTNISGSLTGSQPAVFLSSLEVDGLSTFNSETVISSSLKVINNLNLSKSGIYFGTGSLNLNISQEDKLSYEGNDLATENYAIGLFNAKTLFTLADVSITNLLDGQIIKYDQNSTDFINATLTSSDISDLGTSATLDVGTNANQIVQLDNNAKLPAVDGSQLTGIPINEIYSSKNSDFTAAINYYYSVSTTNNSVDISLPQISTTTAGEKLTIKFRSGTNLLTILPFSGDTIEDINSLTLTDSDNPGQSVTLVSDGSNSWEII